MIFYHAKEKQQESWREAERKITKIISETMQVELHQYDIERAHRIGRKGRHSRPIIVKFNSYKKKMEVLAATRLLQGKRVGVSEDFTQKVRNIREELKVFMFTARQQGEYAVLRHDKLVINERYYTLRELKEKRSQEGDVGEQPSPSRSTGNQTTRESGRNGNGGPPGRAGAGGEQSSPNRSTGNRTTRESGRDVNGGPPGSADRSQRRQQGPQRDETHLENDEGGDPGTAGENFAKKNKKIVRENTGCDVRRWLTGGAVTRNRARGASVSQVREGSESA